MSDVAKSRLEGILPQDFSVETTFAALPVGELFQFVQEEEENNFNVCSVLRKLSDNTFCIDHIWDTRHWVNVDLDVGGNQATTIDRSDIPVHALPVEKEEMVSIDEAHEHYSREMFSVQTTFSNLPVGSIFIYRQYPGGNELVRVKVDNNSDEWIGDLHPTGYRERITPFHSSSPSKLDSVVCTTVTSKERMDSIDESTELPPVNLEGVGINDFTVYVPFKDLEIGEYFTVNYDHTAEQSTTLYRKAENNLCAPVAFNHNGAWSPSYSTQTNSFGNPEGMVRVRRVTKDNAGSIDEAVEREYRPSDFCQAISWDAVPVGTLFTYKTSGIKGGTYDLFKKVDAKHYTLAGWQEVNPVDGVYYYVMSTGRHAVRVQHAEVVHIIPPVTKGEMGEIDESSEYGDLTPFLFTERASFANLEPGTLFIHFSPEDLKDDLDNLDGLALCRKAAHNRVEWLLMWSPGTERFNRAFADQSPESWNMGYQDVYIIPPGKVGMTSIDESFNYKKYDFCVKIRWMDLPVGGLYSVVSGVVSTYVTVYRKEAGNTCTYVGCFDRVGWIPATGRGTVNQDTGFLPFDPVHTNEVPEKETMDSIDESHDVPQMSEFNRDVPFKDVLVGALFMGGYPGLTNQDYLGSWKDTPLMVGVKVGDERVNHIGEFRDGVWYADKTTVSATCPKPDALVLVRPVSKENIDSIDESSFKPMDPSDPNYVSRENINIPTTFEELPDGALFTDNTYDHALIRKKDTSLSNANYWVVGRYSGTKLPYHTGVGFPFIGTSVFEPDEVVYTTLKGKEELTDIIDEALRREYEYKEFCIESTFKELLMGQLFTQKDGTSKTVSLLRKTGDDSVEYNAGREGYFDTSVKHKKRFLNYPLGDHSACIHVKPDEVVQCITLPSVLAQREAERRSMLKEGDGDPCPVVEDNLSIPTTFGELPIGNWFKWGPKYVSIAQKISNQAYKYVGASNKYGTSNAKLGDGRYTSQPNEAVWTGSVSKVSMDSIDESEEFETIPFSIDMCTEERMLSEVPINIPFLWKEGGNDAHGSKHVWMKSSNELVNGEFPCRYVNQVFHYTKELLMAPQHAHNFFTDQPVLIVAPDKEHMTDIDEAIVTIPVDPASFVHETTLGTLAVGDLFIFPDSKETECKAVWVKTNTDPEMDQSICSVAGVSVPHRPTISHDSSSSHHFFRDNTLVISRLINKDNAGSIDESSYNPPPPVDAFNIDTTFDEVSVGELYIDLHRDNVPLSLMRKVSPTEGALWALVDGNGYIVRHLEVGESIPREAIPKKLVRICTVSKSGIDSIDEAHEGFIHIALKDFCNSTSFKEIPVGSLFIEHSAPWNAIYDPKAFEIVSIYRKTSDSTGNEVLRLGKWEKAAYTRPNPHGQEWKFEPDEPVITIPGIRKEDTEEMDESVDPTTLPPLEEFSIDCQFKDVKVGELFKTIFSADAGPIICVKVHVSNLNTIGCANVVSDVRNIPYKYRPNVEIIIANEDQCWIMPVNKETIDSIDESINLDHITYDDLNPDDCDIPTTFGEVAVGTLFKYFSTEKRHRARFGLKTGTENANSIVYDEVNQSFRSGGTITFKYMGGLNKQVFIKMISKVDTDVIDEAHE